MATTIARLGNTVDVLSFDLENIDLAVWKIRERRGARVTLLKASARVSNPNAFRNADS